MLALLFISMLGWSQDFKNSSVFKETVETLNPLFIENQISPDELSLIMDQLKVAAALVDVRGLLTRRHNEQELNLLFSQTSFKIMELIKKLNDADLNQMPRTLGQWVTSGEQDSILFTRQTQVILSSLRYIQSVLFSASDAAKLHRLEANYGEKLERSFQRFNVTCTEVLGLSHIWSSNLNGFKVLRSLLEQASRSYEIGVKNNLRSRSE